MSLFEDVHGWWGLGVEQKAPLLKICCAYLSMMKMDIVVLYLQKIQKTFESRETPTEFCWHQNFFTRNQQILLYQEIQIWTRFLNIISNSFNIFWFFKKCFNKDDNNFDDVSKNGYPRPSEKKGIYNQCSWCHQNILLRDSTHIVDVVLWPKFDNCSITVRKVIICYVL